MFAKLYVRCFVRIVGSGGLASFLEIIEFEGGVVCSVLRVKIGIELEARKLRAGACGGVSKVVCVEELSFEIGVEFGFSCLYLLHEQWKYLFEEVSEE